MDVYGLTVPWHNVPLTTFADAASCQLAAWLAYVFHDVTEIGCVVLASI
jgi:hypothetical protein